MATAIVDRATFLAAFKQAAKFCAKGQVSIPSLKNVLISVEGNKIQLTGSNQNLSAQTTLDAETTGTFKFQIAPKFFGDLLSRMKGSTINIKLLDGVFTVTDGKKTAELTDLQDPEKYPQVLKPLEDSIETLLPTQGLRKVVEKLAPFASNDITKLTLQGIQLGETSFSTDGHRMGRHMGLKESKLPTQVLPALGLLLVKQYLTSAETLIKSDLDNNLTTIVNGDWSYTFKVIDEQYPNCSQLIPAQFHGNIRINVSELLESLSYFEIMPTIGKDCIKFCLNDKGFFLMKDSRSKGKSSCEIQETHQLTDVLRAQISNKTLAFENLYLSQPLKMVRKDSFVTFNINSITSPVTVSFEDDPDFLYLVMPIQIRS